MEAEHMKETEPWGGLDVRFLGCQASLYTETGMPVMIDLPDTNEGERKEKKGREPG